MTFTITPQPDNIPPRVRIDVNSDDSSKPFTALTIKRDGKSLREQPFVGSSAAVLFDYEAPFGVPVSYSAEGVVGTFAQILNATWANLTGWTTYTGSPSVSGGVLVNGGVTRDVTFTTNAGRLIVFNPGSGSGSQVSVGSWLTVQYGSGGVATVTSGGVTRNVSHLSGSLTVTWSGSRVSVSSPQQTAEFDGAAAQTGVATIRARGVSSGLSPFALFDRSGSAPFTATSSTIVAVTDAWLIHPSKPSLSCKIDSGPGAPGTRFIEASSGESKSSQAVSTVHRPVGRRRAVVITSGPRQADEWTLVLESDTIAAKNDLRALVDDQTPLLLRSSASVNRDLPDDWYSVGDVTVTRVEVPVITEASLMTLPLTPVDEPIVRVGALWTWGDVLTTYSTWQQVLDANDTWLDVLAGPQL